MPRDISSTLGPNLLAPRPLRYPLPVKPKVLDGLVLFYGLFLIAMGAIGYIVGHHFMSLVGGGTAGVLVLVFLGITAKKRQLGRIGVATISLLMFFMFAGMLVSPPTPKPGDPPRKVWQAYTTAGVSLVVFLALGMGHMTAMKARRLE